MVWKYTVCQGCKSVVANVEDDQVSTAYTTAWRKTGNGYCMRHGRMV